MKRYWPEAAGIAAGATVGFLYWYFVGCESGRCPITSSPVNSTLWGALFGGLVLSLFPRGGNRK